MGRWTILLLMILSLKADTLSYHDPDSLRMELSRIDTTDRYISTAEGGKRTSPVRMLSDILFFIYSRFVTTQDSHECQFTPSCSHYAKQAVERRHTMEAMLMTSDRLMRCNPTAPGHYPQDSLGFLVDSVEVR